MRPLYSIGFAIFVVTLAVLWLAGCGYKPVPSVVYGAKGTPYSAPTLCEALLKCEGANEASCYYNTTTVIDLQGKSETDTCKEVSK